jgi:hypothetical protein
LIGSIHLSDFLGKHVHKGLIRVDYSKHSVGLNAIDKRYASAIGYNLGDKLFCHGFRVKFNVSNGIEPVHLKGEDEDGEAEEYYTKSRNDEHVF